MPFDHERFQVYQRALDAMVFSHRLLRSLPRGNAHISDQLARASLSVVLNIAEGAGKFSRPDKRRYYLSAIGSATECAAILDVCRRLDLIEEPVWHAGKRALDEIAAMLVALARRMGEKQEE